LRLPAVQVPGGAFREDSSFDKLRSPPPAINCHTNLEGDGGRIPRLEIDTGCRPSCCCIGPRLWGP